MHMFAPQVYAGRVLLKFLIIWYVILVQLVGTMVHCAINGGTDSVREKSIFFEYDKKSHDSLQNQVYNFCTRAAVSNPMCAHFLERVRQRIRLGENRIPLALDRSIEISVDGNSVLVDVTNPPECIDIGLIDPTECNRFQEAIKQYSSLASIEKDTKVKDRKSMDIILRFKICKGYANQRLSLIAGITLAVELSTRGHRINVVLPKFHGSYLNNSPDCAASVSIAKDACTQLGSIMDINAFYDVSRLARTISDQFPNVKFINNSEFPIGTTHRPLSFGSPANLLERRKLNNYVSMEKILE